MHVEFFADMYVLGQSLYEESRRSLSIRPLIYDEKQLIQ